MYPDNGPPFCRRCCSMVGINCFVNSFAAILCVRYDVISIFYYFKQKELYDLLLLSPLTRSLCLFVLFNNNNLGLQVHFFGLDLHIYSRF